MIHLAPTEDIRKAEKIFEKKGIRFNGQPGCITAVCGDTVLGFSLYELENGQMTVHYIEPLSDIPLADGILRSTLHVAAERGIMRAVYGETLPEDFLEKIGFIKSRDERLLNIDKLFKSDCCCKSNMTNQER